ncbi:MAG TPA: acyl-CoA dehydratase activase [Vicinamibacteria bacterium]|nr:acyl-CoA dehydratase activase [Vicinamibacteria bacterium]
MKRPVAAGVDVGSTQTKAVVLDAERRVVARSLVETGANVSRAAERAFEAALDAGGLAPDDVAAVVGTGYGRYKVSFGDAQVTEIGCHARGAQWLFPGTRTVIDMGGQDVKGIRVGDQGDVRDFVMNDKCAAGTGRFLASAAEALSLPLDAIGSIALCATSPVRLSTVCAVFVESDVLSYLAAGRSVEDILGGVHSAIAARTVALVRRVGLEPEITFTGGVSRNVGMVHALEAKLGMKLNVGTDAAYTGALGAALFALERAQAGVPRAGLAAS